MKKVFSYISFLNYIITHPFNKDHLIKTIFRIFWWKINQIFFKFSCIIEIVPNIKCICYPNDSLYSTLVMYQKFPEYGEMQFLLNTLRSSDNFIDIGANIGVYSLLASSRIKNGRIFSFEPSPKISGQLLENINLNLKTEGIKVINEVVSDKTGFVDFDISSNPDYNHISYSVKGKSILRLKATTLDKFISENKINHVKLIKIDVEGAELLVLKGMENTLRSKLVDFLIVEINSEAMKGFGFLPQDVFKYLTAFDFKLYYFDSKFNLKKFTGKLEGAWNIIAKRL